MVHDLAALRAFPWTDAEWVAGRARRQRPDRPLSIYEVQAGSWRRVPEAGNRPLTYRELAEQLPPYVRDLGYTHVELMPVTEYPSDASWGYQVSGVLRPDGALRGAGGPAGLRRRLPRRRDLGVILDWVPAHFAKEGHGLGRFDGGYLYEHHDPRIGEHPVWGTYIFDYGRAEVRNFLLGSARFWLEEYHIDGFRVDAVASMIWLDHARPESHWGTNRPGGRENLDATDFLRRLNETVHETAPGAMTIAEESTSYAWVTHLPGEGERTSLGFDYKWNLGWMHDSLEYFRRRPGAPQHAPRAPHLAHLVRLRRAVPAAPVPRRGGAPQEGAADQDAGRRLAALRQPARPLRLPVRPPGQEAALHGRGVRAVGGVERGAEPGLAPAGARGRRG